MDKPPGGSAGRAGLGTGFDTHWVGLVDTVGDMFDSRAHRGLADRGLEVRKDSLGLAGTGLPA